MNTSKILMDFIFAHEGAIQEYPLLKYLESEWPDFFNELKDKSSLYQKHFLLFHRLYLLDKEISRKNLRLLISPLEIRIINLGNDWAEESAQEQGLGETDALRGFYENISNLWLSESEILQMQRSFWEKYLALDKKAEALTLFGLQHHDKLNFRIVKHRFKQLAQQHHPDKGGDPVFFIQLREAFEQLRRILK